MYIRPNGALSYTQAHSASIPQGSYRTGFTFTPGESFGYFGVNVDGSTGLLACPAGGNETFPYQIFANLKSLKDADVPGGEVAKCLGINALAIPVEGINAWQYT
jgi:hypothetical protein